MSLYYLNSQQLDAIFNIYTTISGTENQGETGWSRHTRKMALKTVRVCCMCMCTTTRNSAVPQSCQCATYSSLTLTCSGEGHLLRETGVVVQENVPDTGVKKLNERWTNHWRLHNNSVEYTLTVSVLFNLFHTEFCVTINIHLVHTCVIQTFHRLKFAQQAGGNRW